MQSTPKPAHALDPISLALDAIVEAIATRTAELVRARIDGERTTAPAPLVSKQALAAQLGISIAGVDRLVRDAKIPFVRVGEVRRFDPVAVRAALEATRDLPSRVEATSDAPVRLLRRGAR
jgi:excisionase family DNA binding protein